MSTTPRQEWKRGPLAGFIASIIATTVCVVGAAASAAALGHPHHAPTYALALTAAAFTVATIVLARLAIHLEHGLRGPAKPLRTLYDLAPAGHEFAGHPVAPARRHPKNGPATRIVFIGLAVVFIGLMVWLSVVLHARAVRSAYTQHHGVSTIGTVTLVHRIHHSSRSSSYNTYDYDVQLFSPVSGASTTRVHDPSQNFHDFFVGDTVRVLVDPKQPGYAEIPGRPYASSLWWLVPLVMGLVFVLVGGLVAWEQVRHRRHRKTLPAAPPQAAASPLT
jgi:hypothetical protein